MTAHDKTDREIKLLQRETDRVYISAQKQVTSIIGKELSRLRERAERLLEAVNAAETMQEKQLAKIKYMALFLSASKTKSFRGMAENVAQTLYEANEEAAKRINRRAGKVYALNYNDIGGDLERDLDGYQFREITEKDAEVAGELTREKVNKAKDKRWNEQSVVKSIASHAVLLYGVDRMAKAVGQGVTGRNRDAARRQASDAMTDAESKGSLDSMLRASDEGYRLKKVWVAVLDNRTRDTHSRYDGIGPVALDYEYIDGLKRPKDPECRLPEEVCNCRCALRYEVDGNAPRTRAAREGEVTGSYKRSKSFEGTRTVKVSQMTYREWMKWRSQ